MFGIKIRLTHTLQLNIFFSRSDATNSLHGTVFVIVTVQSGEKGYRGLTVVQRGGR